VSHFAVSVSTGIKNVGPKKLLKLNVLVVGGEHVLLLAWLDLVAMLKTVMLIGSGIMHYHVHQRLAILRVYFEEEGVAYLVDDDIVQEDGKLVSEALVVELVALLDHVLEGSPNGGDDRLIGCKTIDRALPSNLHEVPDRIH